MEKETNPEEERQAKLAKINEKLKNLSEQANESDEVWDEITGYQAERFEIMNSNERIKLFEERIPDHEEMNEIGMPVDLNTIALDLSGQTLTFDELGEAEKNGIKNLIKEKNLDWIIQDE